MIMMISSLERDGILIVSMPDVSILATVKRVGPYQGQKTRRPHWAVSMEDDDADNILYSIEKCCDDRGKICGTRFGRQLFNNDINDAIPSSSSSSSSAAHLPYDGGLDGDLDTKKEIERGEQHTCT